MEDRPFIYQMMPNDVYKRVVGLPLKVALEQYDWLDFWPVVDENDVVCDVVCGHYPDQGVLYPRNTYTYDERRDVYVYPAEEE